MYWLIEKILESSSKSKVPPTKHPVHSTQEEPLQQHMPKQAKQLIWSSL